MGKRTVKVAVIGSGLAGLTAAYMLNQPLNSEEVEFDVHIFEKAPCLGMDSASVDIPITEAKDGKLWRVDVPMRSFQGGYYQNVEKLYKRIGAAFRQADFSYSFSKLIQPQSNGLKNQIVTSVIYNGSSGRNGVSMPAFMHKPFEEFKDRSFIFRSITRVWTYLIFVLATFQILLCFSRVIFLSLPIWKTERLKWMSFAEWSEITTPRAFWARILGLDVVWTTFVHDVLLPLYSAVCTAPAESVWQHPVEEFLDYNWLTFGTHHYTMVYGVRDVVSRMTKGLKNIHVSSQITNMYLDEHDPSSITLECLYSTGNITHSGFHHIIFATQATRAVPLLNCLVSSLPEEAIKLRTAVEKQLECLRTFTYLQTIVINHTDDDLLPDDIQDRRDLNLVAFEAGKPIRGQMEEVSDSKDDYRERRTVDPTCAMTTHMLKPPEGVKTDRPLFQTTNPTVAPAEGYVKSVTTLERALLTLPAKKALTGLYQEDRRELWECYGRSRLGPLQGAGRLQGYMGPGIFFIGSYASAGIPLLEGCVVSARTVVEQGILNVEGVNFPEPLW